MCRIAVLLLGLAALLPCAAAVKLKAALHNQDHHLVMLGRFDFSPNDAGVLTLQSTTSSSLSSSSTTPAWQVLLIPPHKLARLMHQFNTSVSLCDMSQLASHALPVPHQQNQHQHQSSLIKGGGLFSLVAVQSFDGDPCDKHLVALHSDTTPASSSSPVTLLLEAHAQNWDLGWFQELSSTHDLWVSLALLVYSLVLCRFQLATVRLVWHNTGAKLALYVFALCAAHLAVHSVGLLALLWFAVHGHAASTWACEWTATGAEYFYLVLLFWLSRGWMVLFPAVLHSEDASLPDRLAVLVAFPVLTLAVPLLFDNMAATCRLVVFVWMYSALARWMKRSRGVPGSVLRGKVWGPVTVLLIAWYVGWPLAPGSTLPLGVLVWTFRAEVLWELHGERPHIEVVRMMDSHDDGDNKALVATRDSESEGLL